jgi:YegS/Rv2252/BmrU family lipid kinase
MIDLIVNPIAGGRKGKKLAKTLKKIMLHLSKRKVEYAVHVAKEHKGSREKTRELIENGATDIVALGGDGTLHEVLNGLVNLENVRLGIIPCGTGNDFADAIHLPKNAIKAIDLIIDGEAKYTDFMQMPTVRGLNVIGTGIDVDVLKRYNQLKRKTKFGYTSCLIKTLFNFKYTDFDVNIDEKKQNLTSFVACVCNGHRFGGGIPVCPIASPSDNKLDFIAVKQMKPLKIIGAFIKLKAGKIFSLKQTVHSKAERVKVDIPTPYTVNVDGELYDNIPFEINVVSNKLKIYRP